MKVYKLAKKIPGQETQYIVNIRYNEIIYGNEKRAKIYKSSSVASSVATRLHKRWIASKQVPHPNYYTSFLSIMDQSPVVGMEVEEYDLVIVNSEPVEL